MSPVDRERQERLHASYVRRQEAARALRYGPTLEERAVRADAQRRAVEEGAGWTRADQTRQVMRVLAL